MRSFVFVCDEEVGRSSPPIKRRTGRESTFQPIPWAVHLLLPFFSWANKESSESHALGEVGVESKGSYYSIVPTCEMFQAGSSLI